MARKGKRNAASGHDAADQDQQDLHGGAAVETAAPGADAQAGVLAGGVHAPEGDAAEALSLTGSGGEGTAVTAAEAVDDPEAAEYGEPPDFEAEVTAFEAQLAGVPIAETREQFMNDLATYGVAAAEAAADADVAFAVLAHAADPVPLTEDMALWCAYRAARAVVSAMRGDQIDDAMLARMYPNFATAGLLAAFIRQNRDAPIQALTVHAYGPRYPSFFDLPPLEQFAWTVFHDTFRAHMRLLG